MTFSDLDDAFAELERRADATGDLVVASGPGRPHRGSRPHPARRRTSRVAVLASAAGVAAVAVGISLSSGSGTHHNAGAAEQPSRPVTAPVPSSARPTTPAPKSTAPATQAAVRATDVPKTQAALIARFRSILGGSATFTVDAANSSNNLITGVLTSSSGTRGMYVLELDKNVSICGTIMKAGQPPSPLPCPGVTKLADGSKLKIDPNFPDGPTNGVMNDAILNRPDGWQISLSTANVQGKYVGAPVLGPQPALTVKQVTDIVTSPQWLAN